MILFYNFIFSFRNSAGVTCMHCLKMTFLHHPNFNDRHIYKIERLKTTTARIYIA